MISFSASQRSGAPGVTSLSGLGWGKVGGCPNGEDLASSVGGCQEPPQPMCIFFRASHACWSHPWCRRTSSSVSTYLPTVMHPSLGHNWGVPMHIRMPNPIQVSSSSPGPTHILTEPISLFFPEEHKSHPRLKAGLNPEVVTPVSGEHGLD